MKSNLTHIHTFYIAAQHKSMRTAAKHLHVSPAAVSLQIRKLEDYLDFPLFIRKGNGLELSEQGLIIFPLAEKIFLHAAELDETLDALAIKQQEVLHIGMHHMPAEQYMPDLLNIFAHKAPHVEVKIVIGNHVDTLQGLRNGNIHIGILGEKDADDMLYQELITSDVVFATCSNNPLIHEKVVSLELLQKTPLLLPPSNTSFSMYLHKFLKKYDIAPAKTMENLADSVSKKLIPNSAYGAFFDIFSIQSELQSGTLQCLKLFVTPPKYTLYCCFLAQNKNVKNIQNFLQALPSPQDFSRIMQEKFKTQKIKARTVQK